VAERLVSMYIDYWQCRDREEGQTAVEYALVLALVAIALGIALATGLTGSLDSAITKIKNALT
jgi:Flp pilus assembly pilin Flp